MLLALSPLNLSLRRAREAAGLTQSQLADAVKVRQATISDLETGKSRRLDLDLLDALCEALGVAPGNLLEREPEKPKRRKSA